MKSNLSRVALAMLTAGGLLAHGQAALKSAKVSDYEGDVTLSKGGGAAQQVKVDSTVTPSDVVRTGNKSLAELEFNDKTLTRLGANTIFSYSPQNREFEVQTGTALLQVPPGLGGAKIQTAAVTAAITGTTVMVQKLPSGVVKLLVLEGSMNATLKGSNQMRSIKAGEMLVIPPNLKTLPQTIQVNVATIMGTSKLIKGFNEKLSSKDKIEKTVDKQKELTENGGMKTGGMVITSSQDLMNIVGNQVLSSATFDTLTQRIVDTQEVPDHGGNVIPPGNPYIINAGATITPNVNGVAGNITTSNGTVLKALPPTSTDPNFTIFALANPVVFTGQLPSGTQSSTGGLSLTVAVDGIGIGESAITFANITNGDKPLDFGFIFINSAGGDISFNHADMDVSETFFYSGYGYYGDGAGLKGDLNIKDSKLTISEKADNGVSTQFYSSNKLLIDNSSVEIFSTGSNGMSIYSENGVSIQDSNLVSNKSGNADYINVSSRGNININNAILGGAGTSSLYVAAMNNANLTVANSTLRAQYVVLTGATLRVSNTVIQSPSIVFYTNNFVNGGGNHFTSTPTIQPYNSGF